MPYISASDVKTAESGVLISSLIKTPACTVLRPKVSFCCLTLYTLVCVLLSSQQKQCLVKDTLQTEMSDVRLDEVQVFVSVVVLLLQCADGVALWTEG